MIPLPPISTRTDTLFPNTTLFRSLLHENGDTMPLDWNVVMPSLVSAVSGLCGVWLGGQLTFKREARREADRIKRESNYLVILVVRSEEHTSELQSLMRISSAVFCLKKKNKKTITKITTPYIP